MFIGITWTQVFIHQQILLLEMKLQLPAHLNMRTVETPQLHVQIQEHLMDYPTVD